MFQLKIRVQEKNKTLELKLSGLTEEEINKMKDEAKANEDTDKKEEKVDKLNTADGLIFQTEKQLKEFGEKLSEPNKKAIEDSLKIKGCSQRTKNYEIDEAVEALNKSWEATKSEIYKATQEQQAANGDWS